MSEERTSLEQVTEENGTAMNNLEYCLYRHCTNSRDLWKTGTLADVLAEMEFVEQSGKVRKIRSGDTRPKRFLTCFCPMGRNIPGTTRRLLGEFESNGRCMIDFDHLFRSAEEAEEFRPLFLQRQAGALGELHVKLVHLTVSGKGLRIVLPLIKGCGILTTAIAAAGALRLPVGCVDTACTDLTRLSILSNRSDVWLEDAAHDGEGETVEAPEGFPASAENALRLHGKRAGRAWIPGEVDEWLCARQPECTLQHVNGGEEPAAGPAGSPATGLQEEAVSSPRQMWSENNTNLTVAEIARMDDTYKHTTWHGRKLHELCEEWMNATILASDRQKGSRHGTYMHITKQWRNVCGGNAAVLHAIAPRMGLPLVETMSQCQWSCSKSKTDHIPLTLYKWLEQRGYTQDLMTEEDILKATPEDEEDGFYTDFVIARCPVLPPILAEYWRVAPKWFKLPMLVSAECVCALLATNRRSTYIDGASMSTSLYTLVYAPQSSGKSFLRRLEPLLRDSRYRDSKAFAARDAYLIKARTRAANENLGEYPHPKQRVLMAKTSCGEICASQANNGEHHWLQIVPEFDTWANQTSARRGDLSDLYRTAWDNDYYGQQFMSVNAFSGCVRIYPIVLGTCTPNQIDSFFTNVEDGLVTRFLFVPLLNQEYADLQRWDDFTVAEWMRVSETVNRLNEEVFKGGSAMSVDGQKMNPLGTAGNDWDYEYNEPGLVNMSFCHGPLKAWLTEKLEEARADANPELAMLRKRSAVRAFKYAMICDALWPRRTEQVREYIVQNMLWMAEVDLHYMRLRWEQPLKAAASAQGADIAPVRLNRHSPIFQMLPDAFTLAELHRLYSESGRTQNNAFAALRYWLKTNKLTYNEQDKIYSKTQTQPDEKNDNEQ